MKNKPIKIEYDSVADALYIRIKSGRVFKTKRNGFCLTDFDKKGLLLGLEVLNYSKQACFVPKAIKTVLHA